MAEIRKAQGGICHAVQVDNKVVVVSLKPSLELLWSWAANVSIRRFPTWSNDDDSEHSTATYTAVTIDDFS
jgi:hypothetical protein